MRRAFICVPLALFILAFGGSAQGVTHEYTDAAGDAGNAIDFTRVTVSDPAGDFHITVYVTNQRFLDSGDRLDVLLNTDRNPNTGWFGAEYLVKLEASETNCFLYRWNGQQFQAIRNLSFCPFDYGVTFVISRADVGNPPAFDFWLSSYWPLPPNNTSFDRAPDSGSWVYDYTPPDTAITSGPSGSTPDRNASFSFTSTEGGSTFQCSLDRAGFTGCASGASYANLGFGNHNFQVRATDAYGNTDPSPAARTWTVVDAVPPTVQVRRGVCCKEKGEAVLEYQIADNSGVAASTVGIYRLGSSRPANVCSFGSDGVPRNYANRCKVPASARGWLRFCVQATDAAGNHSPDSCKRLAFDRLNTDLVWRYAKLGGGAARITTFRFRALQGGRRSVRCRGCTLHAGVVGTVLQAGARIEARVMKPRLRGYYVRLTNRGGAVSQFEACLPPGLSGPVISCARRS